MEWREQLLRQVQEDPIALVDRLLAGIGTSGLHPANAFRRSRGLLLFGENFPRATRCDHPAPADGAMGGWVEQIALLLLGLCQVMWQEMKKRGYLQIDETPVKVLDPEIKGKAATGYLWFYSVPHGDVIVEFCSGRGQEAPKARLEGFQGTIQSDAYDVYPCLERDLPGLRRPGCLAHSRRKFYQALRQG